MMLLIPTLLPEPEVPVDRMPGTPPRSIDTGWLGLPGAPKPIPTGRDQTSLGGTSNG